MGVTAVTYTAPIRRPGRAGRPDFEELEHAHALAEAGLPREAIQKAFAHLFPAAVVPDLTAAPFTFVQGSSRVSVRIVDDELVITVPLVMLPTDSRAIAALRFVLTRCGGSGQTHQPRLRGDAIELEFRSKIAHLHPAKLVEALRAMPFQADSTDDWMIDQFGATPIDRAPIAPLDADELARAEAFWRAHWAEIEDLLQDSRRKRSVWFLNEITAFTCHRLQYVLPLSGSLLGRMNEAAATFNDADANPDRRETALARFIKEMKALTPADLARQLGHAEYAISPLEDGSADRVLGYIGSGSYIETIGRLRTTGKPMEAALALASTYTFLLASATWPEPVRIAMEEGLALASGKPWREAAALLWAHAQALAAVLRAEGAVPVGDDLDEDDEGASGDADDESAGAGGAA